MESPVSSRSSFTGRSILTAPLMGEGMDGFGAPQLTTMMAIRNGDFVRVSFHVG